MINDLDSALDKIDLSHWESYLSGIPAPSPNEFIKELAGGGLDIRAFLGDILDLVLRGARDLIPLFVMVVSICVLSAISTRLKSGIGSKKACELAFLLIIALPVCALMKDALALTNTAIGRACALASQSLPTICAILTALGANAAAGAASPIILLCAQGAGYFSSKILPALISCLCACALMSAMSGDKAADGLFDFINSFSIFALTGTLALFSASAAICVKGAATADSITLRTAKYAIDNYVPIVGGIFADSFEILKVCCFSLKNAVGLTACAYIALICLPQIVSSALSSLMLNLSYAISKLLGAECISEFLGKLSKAFTLLLSGQLSCLLALLITASALIQIGNGL